MFQPQGIEPHPSAWTAGAVTFRPPGLSYAKKFSVFRKKCSIMDLLMECLMKADGVTAHFLTFWPITCGIKTRRLAF